MGFVPAYGGTSNGRNVPEESYSNICRELRVRIKLLSEFDISETMKDIVLQEDWETKVNGHEDTEGFSFAGLQFTPFVLQKH